MKEKEKSFTTFEKPTEARKIVRYGTQIVIISDFEQNPYMLFGLEEKSAQLIIGEADYNRRTDDEIKEMCYKVQQQAIYTLADDIAREHIEVNTDTDTDTGAKK